MDNLRHSSRLGMNSGRRSYSVNTFHTISTGAATVVSAMHLLASCLPWSTILTLIRPSGEAVEVERERERKGMDVSNQICRRFTIRLEI